MTSKPEPTIDPLRARLAAPELREARAELAAGGVAGVIRHARSAIAGAQAARARLDALGREMESASPEERARALERYLRATTGSPAALAADLRALRKRRTPGLDLPALGERVARHEDRAELRAEVALALAGAALDPADAETIPIAELVALAVLPGRWSRRTEACSAIGKIAPHLPPGARAEVAASLRTLLSRDEHRWVQPQALAALAAIEPGEAAALAEARLREPGDGDDLLVRARIVTLAARWPEAGGSGIVALAARDPSDLVRMEAARRMEDPGALALLARDDRSHKVRAVALLALVERFPAAAEPALLRAVAEDAHGFVVRTAAEELAALAQAGKLGLLLRALDALALGASRRDVDAKVRAACRDALVEVDVMSAPLLRATHAALAPIVAATPVGGATRVTGEAFAALSDAELGRVLAVLARDDFALGVDRERGGLVLYRGEARVLAPWRVLFELKNPAPSKRQAFVHTSGRRPRGRLRAPPGGMGELTATRVPGERVVVDRLGEWGRHLPLVDDLLSTGVLFPRAIALASSFGTTTLVPRASLAGRLRALLTMTVRYKELVDLRQRALESDEPATQTAYLREVTRATGIAAHAAPYALGKGYAPLALPVPVELRQDGVPRAFAEPSTAASTTALSLLAGPPGVADGVSAWARETAHDLLSYAVSPVGNRLPHLAGYALALLGAMVVRAVAIRRSVDHDRRAIPLVVGGWGTRGKSGTERLKAALFQGLGHECLVKTTGCEAMFIHAMPGVPAREIFIHRPYDKATIWEQRDVLALARRLGVRVFLWECMALQPDLVSLLQHQWMQDDCSTITNAYPDHEDVQGPAGVDVATVISEFVPKHGRLFTAEDQMLPILRERARERGTTLRVVGARDAELVADDLLARFPYQEHPKNIALVATLARSLGISATIAVAEMADNVVPDLGVLKTYPTVSWRGRTLSFSNGMSANERTGALSNWRRTGLDRHEPDGEPARWIVTVVNNRADRVARSEVFARFLVEDIAAHRHVLIGTNVGGLAGFLREALDRHVAALSVTRDLTGSPEERRHIAGARVERAFARLEVGRTDAESVLAELAALRFPELPRDLVERLLAPERPGEPFAAGKRAVDEGIPASVDAERRPFVVSMIARRRAVRGVVALLDTSLAAAPAAVDEGFGAAYRALFDEGVVPLHDASLTGDQIIDRIAAMVPPGAHASIMGVQNIKGTGLDFVYRWVSIDMVHRALRGLGSPGREQRAQALRDLALHDDYGLVDATLALEAVEAARARDPGEAASHDAVAVKLRAVVAARKARLAAKGKTSALDRFRGLWGETLDFLDAIRRRGMASDLLDELVAGRVSHAAAAVRMREIVARSKGAWAKAKAR